MHVMGLLRLGREVKSMPYIFMGPGDFNPAGQENALTSKSSSNLPRLM